MKYKRIIIAVSFIWIGFVCAISFMEAWLKFKAPGITLPLGLGIGRLVYNALNNVELFLSVLISAAILLSNKKSIFLFNNLFFYIPLAILLIQTFWLLPTLDLRAQMHIDGDFVPKSNLHFYYVGLEVSKVTCLLIYGIKLLKNINTRKNENTY